MFLYFQVFPRSSFRIIGVKRFSELAFEIFKIDDLPLLIDPLVPGMIIVIRVKVQKPFSRTVFPDEETHGTTSPHPIRIELNFIDLLQLEFFGKRYPMIIRFAESFGENV